jgi:hypothetical protein
MSHEGCSAPLSIQQLSLQMSCRSFSLSFCPERSLDNPVSASCFFELASTELNMRTYLLRHITVACPEPRIVGPPVHPPEIDARVSETTLSFPLVALLNQHRFYFNHAVLIP